MKRLLVLAVLLVLVAVPVVAEQIDFQDSEDVDDRTITLSSFSPTQPSSSYWARNGSSGNSYACTQFYPATTSESGAGIGYNVGTPSTYFAGTFVSKGNGTGYCPSILLFDGSKNLLAFMGGESMESGVCAVGKRYEVTITGTTARLYVDGSLQESETVAQNPSFVTFGASNKDYNSGIGSAVYMCWDDLVYGTSEDRVIAGFPEERIYYIKKDVFTPSANGLYYSSNNTLVSSEYFQGTYGNTNLPSSAINETLYLRNIHDLTNYQTRFTGTNPVGSITWNITDFIEQDPPYGFYQASWANGTNPAASGRIEYLGGGAVVTFDQDSYAYEDTATISYVIESDYWAAVTSPTIEIIDLYGDTIETIPLITNTGNVSYKWDDDDSEGSYYAVAKGTYDGDEIWMAVDYAELEAYFNLQGHVNDAETGLPIAAANVTITQGSTTMALQITAADGNYTATGGLLGTVLTINTTATGYFQYLTSFAPTAYGTKDVNITLNSTTPTYTGLGIGGVVRDGIFDGTTITSGYGRPIQSATCYAKNTTNSELYSASTNMAGWYLFDESTPAFLTTKRPYDIWCEKVGYGNSPNYTAVTA